MAKDENCDKLKLVHLVWMILIVVATCCLAWGTQKNQLKVNTANIEKKVDKTVFELVIEQQKDRDKEVNKKLDTIIGRL